MSHSKLPAPIRPRIKYGSVLAATMLSALPAAHAINYTWNNTGTDWSAPSSWTPSSGSGIPSSGGDLAIFSAAAATNPNLSASVAISRLTANSSSATGYHLTSSGGATLTLGSTGTGTSSAINYTPSSGSLTIDAAVILGAAQGSTQSFHVNSSGGTLAVNGSVSSTSAVTLLKSGGGTLLLSNSQNSYSGGSVVSGGTLALTGAGVLGSGGLTMQGGTFDISAIASSTYTLGAALSGSGTLAGGGKTLAVNALSAGGTLVAAEITLSLSGTSTFSFTDPAFAAESYDRITGSAGTTEAVIFGGTLSLNFSGGNYANGSSVQIFDMDLYSGAFNAVTYTGLEPGQEAIFDAATGFVTVIPEPGTWLLVACGAVGVAMQRRGLRLGGNRG